MNRGYVKIYRKIEDNILWLSSDESFDSRSAWIDLILLANHKDNSFKLGMQTIKVKRGQKWTSSIKLANRWSWSRQKVMKYLHMLQNEGMIYLETSNRGLLITIVNYRVYQQKNGSAVTADVTADVTSAEHQMQQQMDTNKNGKNDIKNDIKNEKKKALFSDSGEGGIVYEE